MLSTREEYVQKKLSLTSSRRYTENPEQALIQEAFKVFQDAASKNRLVQLTCNNGGHTDLLGAHKVRVDP